MLGRLDAPALVAGPITDGDAQRHLDVEELEVRRGGVAPNICYEDLFGEELAARRSDRDALMRKLAGGSLGALPLGLAPC